MPKGHRGMHQALVEGLSAQKKKREKIVSVSSGVPLQRKTATQTAEYEFTRPGSGQI